MKLAGMPKESALQFTDHRTCEALTGLTLEQLPRDGSLGCIQHYDSGAIIWNSDDRADRIYFLRRGQVAIMISDPQGREVNLRSIAPGELFGELCYCSAKEGLRETISRAILESEVVEISLDDFIKYLQQHQEALTALMFTFCTRLSEAERRAEILAYRGAEERLGRLLLQLARTRSRLSTVGEDCITLHISHDELAQMAAMNRSHVTVTMGKLRDRNLLRYERNQPLTVYLSALSKYLNEKQS